MSQFLNFVVHVVIAFKTINTLAEVGYYIIHKIKRRQMSTFSFVKELGNEENITPSISK